MMDAPPCALKFNGYVVKTIEFIKNESSSTNIGVDIGKKFNYDDKYPGKFIVGLKITLGDKDHDAMSPFYLCVELLGEFEVVESEIDKVKQFAEINAVSILFPYARALITTITANANIPPVVLPPLNIAGMMEKEYKESSDEEYNKMEEWLFNLFYTFLPELTL